MNIRFLGAARKVTGSMFLLTTDSNFKVLIDCGWEANHQNQQLAVENEESVFPFTPSEIDAVILTHAHLDHSGKIPLLIKEGFEGFVYCTPATYDLCQLLLLDSAGLHAKRLAHLSRQKHLKNLPIERLVTPDMYFSHHVESSFKHFRTVSFNKKVRLNNEFYFQFNETGHLLGASNVIIEIERDNKITSLCFSGDIGRKNYPLLRDPKPVPQVDYLICESTYGARRHQDNRDPKVVLAEQIQRYCIDIPGRLIIPAFSVGRTQALLFTLFRLFEEDGFQPIRVFSDSPMAMQSTQVYEKHDTLLNEDALAFKSRYGELFDFDNLELVKELSKSKNISNYHEPAIIISSSGMISGGRIEHHLRQNLGNPSACFFFIGYAAEGTLGYDLQNGLKYLRMGSKEYEIRACVEKTDVFSGHGDLDDLRAFVNHQNKGKLKKIFLVHGDEDSIENFQSVLQTEGYPVEVPERNQTFELN